MEINPYQSPHVEDPRPVRRNLRRRVGVGVILLLTPLAVGVALFGSCAVAVTLPQLSMWWLTVVVPLFVLTALMTYAAAIDERRSQGEPRSRERYLMATPRVVAAAALVGIGLAVLIVGSRVRWLVASVSQVFPSRRLFSLQCPV